MGGGGWVEVARQVRLEGHARACLMRERACMPDACAGAGGAPGTASLSQYAPASSVEPSLSGCPPPLPLFSCLVFLLFLGSPPFFLVWRCCTPALRTPPPQSLSAYLSLSLSLPLCLSASLSLC
eukprot:2686678-Rhodomonas_salina.1